MNQGTLPYMKLWQATETNDVAKVDELLSQLVLTWDEGIPVARHAAEHGSWDVLEQLLKAGAGFYKGRIAADVLMGLCVGRLSEEEILPRMDDLLNRGADPNGDWQTVLHFAARHGFTKVAKRLLEAGADPTRRTNQNGNTPLHETCYNCALHPHYANYRWQPTLPLAELLLEYGASVHDKGHFEQTPLHVAVETKYRDMATFLLARGADPNAVSIFGNTPLHHAIHQISPPRFIEDKNFRQSENFASAVVIFHQLLKAGADVNAVTGNGDTVLATAAEENADGEFVDALISHGANVHTVNNESHSPLAYAVKNKNTAVVNLLLAQNADPLAGANRRSAIEAAILVGSTPILKKLLAQTQNLDLSANSVALLEAAVKTDAANCIQLLIPFGVKPEGPFPPKKQTPLHLAAHQNAVRLLEICLKAGADGNARDRLGRTPLYMAARHNRAEAIRLLRQFKADATIADKDGKTPLDIAQEKNKKRALAALTAP